jgi:hypothetical protein
MADTVIDVGNVSSKTTTSWVTVVLSSILAIVVTVVGALIVGKVQAQQPHLSYSYNESIPFSGASNTVSIYQVTITNDGKKEIEGISCVIRIPFAKIEQFKSTASPSLAVNSTVAGDSLKSEVANLNPAEAVQFTVLASSQGYLPNKPEVSVRGKGVNGENKQPTGQAPISSWFTAAIATSAVGLTATFSSVFLRRMQMRSGRGNDQRQILAYLCRIHGFSELADGYLSKSHKTTYWAESDRLAQLAVESHDAKYLDSMKQMLRALMDYATLAKSSKAIIYHNLARIEALAGTEAECEKYVATRRS